MFVAVSWDPGTRWWGSLILHFVRNMFYNICFVKTRPPSKTKKYNREKYLQCGLFSRKSVWTNDKTVPWRFCSLILKMKRNLFFIQIHVVIYNSTKALTRSNPIFRVTATVSRREWAETPIININAFNPRIKSRQLERTGRRESRKMFTHFAR